LLPAAAADLLAGAAQHAGSWWTDWQAWVTEQDNTMVPARDPAKGRLGVIEDAPGSFVKFRLDAQNMS
jgi:polyhydroxyalkanoate synthase